MPVRKIMKCKGIFHRTGILTPADCNLHCKGIFPAAVLLTLCILCSCSGRQNIKTENKHVNHATPPLSPAAGQSSSSKNYPCWDILGEQIPNNTFPQQTEELPPENAFVWGGTVSHHLLAGNEIERWFYKIAQRRKKIDTFFIICPSHFGLSVQKWSLDNCTWQTKYGTVFTNEKIERQISECLGVPYDPQVFQNEHGVSTLIPFIKKYYPNAKICTIAVQGEPPLNQADAQKLSQAISPYFTKHKRKNNFLLISTDFSHHGNLERTEQTDKITREFFKNPNQSSWITCGCDNRPGMYVLAKQCSPKTKACILYHTNSYELSGHGENDITSYFFTLFYK